MIEIAMTYTPSACFASASTFSSSASAISATFHPRFRTCPAMTAPVALTSAIAPMTCAPAPWSRNVPRTASLNPHWRNFQIANGSWSSSSATSRFPIRRRASGAGGSRTSAKMITNGSAKSSHTSPGTRTSPPFANQDM